MKRTKQTKRTMRKRSVRRGTKKQRGGERFSSYEKAMKYLMELQKTRKPEPGMKFSIVNHGESWQVYETPMTERELKSSANNALAAGAKLSRSLMNKTGASKKIMALRETIEKGAKPGASAKDKLKGQIAQKELDKI